jgi:hypothetical protein
VVALVFPPPLRKDNNQTKKERKARGGVYLSAGANSARQEICWWKEVLKKQHLFT